MAEITRLLGAHHLRSGPTTWVRHVAAGRERRAGVGLSFWFRLRTAALSEVPVDDRELALVCHARTRDHAELSIPLGITYRIDDPGLAAQRLDFGIDVRTGAWHATPLETLATVLGELAQQPVLGLVAAASLADALAAGPDPVERVVTERLVGSARLAELGVTVAGVRALGLRAAPELERALRTPTREQAQAEADRATYARRAQAVEQERTIAENELQSSIELARREEQLVARRGANAARQAELDAAAALVTARAAVERDDLAAAAELARARAGAAAEAERVRAVGLAEADAERARLAASGSVPPEVLGALALRDAAGRLPAIGQLTVAPDVVSALVARLAGGDAA